MVQVLSRSNGDSGVLVDGSVGTYLAAVTALDNAPDGVMLMDGRRSALLGVVAGNNAGDGIWLSGAGLPLSDGVAGNVFRGALVRRGEAAWRFRPI